MKIQFVGTGPEPEYKWAIIAALAATEQILLADGQPFHRDFAAMAIASPAGGGHGGDYEKFLSEGLLYEAWIGNMDGVREATWDYLENAKHKAYTDWRTGIRNGKVLIYERHLLKPDDSLWPGTYSCCDAIAATSALLPHQDDKISRIFCKILDELMSPNDSAYSGYDPPQDRDLVDGTSFSHPPKLW